jgi:uncharacterized protein (TIGR02466 family)
MRIENLFPTPINLIDIDDEPMTKALHDDIIKADKKIKNGMPDGWNAKLRTSFESDFDVLALASFQQLQKYIFQNTKAFALALGYDVNAYPLRISDIWYNIYRPGDWQEAHIHTNNVISGIYYVAAPEKCGDLIVHSPYSEQMIDPPQTEATIYNSASAAVHPRTGLMVLFRSCMKHSVKINRANKARISIAFNLMM